MKNSTRKILIIVTLFVVLSFVAKSQTNVSGGIYTNTTWTLANGPYIVVDTVVVFPGVTLTIEPGVTVKFADGKYMEIRQGTFIAAGTVTDSITFTSNSATPYIGIYNGIVFNTAATTIDYCIFKYAANPLNLISSSLVTTVIQHSSFYMNNSCIPSNSNIIIKQSSFYNNNSCISDPSLINIKQSSFYNNISCIGDPIGAGWVNNCSLDSCTFINNAFVAYLGEYGHVTNSIFLNNSRVFKIRGGLPMENHLVENCIFCNNQVCIFTIGYSLSNNNERLINCNFSNNGIALGSRFTYITGNLLADNDTAAYIELLPTDSVFNNYIFHNQVGILYSGGASAAFFNNYICNNTLYNINYTSPNNGSIPPVCFCDTDSATIRSTIYDGYVDITRGLLNFTPFVNCDSSAITALPPLNCQTVIFTQVDAPNHLITETLESYPNPASDHITLNLSKNISKAQLKIFNILGELKYSTTVSSQKTNVDISRLSDGVYFLEATSGNKIYRQKFIKQ